MRGRAWIKLSARLGLAPGEPGGDLAFEFRWIYISSYHNMSRIVISCIALTAWGATLFGGGISPETVAPPRNLLVLPQTETDTSLALLWDKPEAPANVAGYEIYQNDDLVGKTPANRTFWGAINLQPDKVYSFKVVATNSGGDQSPASATITVSTKRAEQIIDVSAPPYNAKGDGHTKNTVAIQKAIDACPAGGTVNIPAGVFVSGALVLKSNLSFHISSGGILKGSIDPDDYSPMIRTRYMGVESDCYQPLIRVGLMDRAAGYTTRNVAIYGEGEIRGGGETLGLQEPYDQRSRLISIQNAQNVAIMGLHLTFPAGWVIHPLYSDNVTAWKVWIESWDAYKGKSGDGFDPDSSTNCYLVDSVVHTWDNSFSPKSGRGLEGYQIARPTRHIRVVGCTLEHGAPSLGSEVSGGIEDIVVRDSTVVGTYFYIKTNDGRGGFIRDFTLENVEFTGDSDRAIWVDTNYEVRNRPPKAPVLTECGHYTFRNIRGAGSITMDGDFQLGGGPDRKSYIHQVELTDVELKTGSGISLKYCDNVKFTRVRCADGRPPAYALDGVNYNIVVDDAVLAK